MNITGIERIIYGVEDLDAAIRFHTDWGLDPVARDETSAEFSLANGSGLTLRRADDLGLPPADVNWLHFGASTVREVIWAAADQATLDAIGAELAKDRALSEDADGVLHTTDDQGYHIGFAVASFKDQPLNLPEINTVGTTGRWNKPAEAALRRRIHPLRYVHVVYWVPGDTAAAIRFYTDRLGFVITDDMTIGGAFMRCAGARDHHNLFLQKSSDGFYGFQHVAYEVKDLDEVGMLGEYMENADWQTNVGPIRHNICSSFSWYLWNPAGGCVEALSDIDHCDEDWEVRTINPRDPGFYGHSWSARPEHRGVRPAQWLED
jgi:catechol 2,3-dioxygenase-like lactoylglutathione lyase family enzyme